MSFADASHRNSILPRRRRTRNEVGIFQKMGLVKDLLKGILFMGYEMPTPIQRKAIPILLDGHDICAMARTGSGKSAAFLIPLLQHLKEHSTTIGVRGLVLSPTRDLALQTARFAKKLSKYLSLRICLVIGGEAVADQFAGLAMNPDIIIATPGRVSFLLKEVPSFSLHKVRHLVFDEADRLFEMGFAVQLRYIMNSMSSDNRGKRQTMLFSATLPESVQQFSRAALSNPIVVRLDTDIKVSPDLQLSYLYCRDDDKLALLLYLLQKMVLDDKLVLIFAATRYHVELIQAFLKVNNLNCVSCFGSMEQYFRKLNIRRFTKKMVPIMVVTDVAARGLDIPLLDYVINFQMSTSVKAFVHRVGRVARNGMTGVAISIVNADELPYLADVYRFLEYPLPIDEANASIGSFEGRLRPQPVVFGSDLKEEDSDESDDDIGSEVRIGVNGVVEIEEEEDDDMAHGGLFKVVSSPSNEGNKSSLIFGDKVSFGSVPPSVLHPYVATVLDCFDKELDLVKLKEACDKSMDIYTRTRTRPTKNGIRASKEINCRVIHPLFRGTMSKVEQRKTAMMDSIASFKANTTIFETGGASNPSYKVMKMKRQQIDRNSFGMDKVLAMKQKESERRNRKSMKEMRSKKKLKKTNEYRNSQFFIENETSSTKQGEFDEEVLRVHGEDGDALKQFVLELDDDERSTINKKKKLYRFNKNTGKYVTEYMGDRLMRFMEEKNESNNVVKGDHRFGKVYAEWTRKTMKEIAVVGSAEHESTANIEDRRNWMRLKDLGRKKYRHTKGSEEWFANKRARARIMAMRDETIEKHKKRKERMKKEEHKRFVNWWRKNRDRVKMRKSARKQRPF